MNFMVANTTRPAANQWVLDKNSKKLSIIEYRLLGLFKRYILIFMISYHA